MDNRVFDGNYTFKKADRKSQNDFLISNMFGLSNINEFKILDICWNPSDHKPVTLIANIHLPIKDVRKAASADILTFYADTLPRKQRKINTSNVNWDTYKTIAMVDLERFQIDAISLQQSLDINNMDLFVRNLSSSLYNAVTVAETKPGRNVAIDQMSERFEIHNEIDLRNSVIKDELKFWNDVISSNDSKAL